MVRGLLRAFSHPCRTKQIVFDDRGHNAPTLFIVVVLPFATFVAILVKVGCPDFVTYSIRSTGRKKSKLCR